jgi:branched-chain amino acid aminotransferase
MLEGLSVTRVRKSRLAQVNFGDLGFGRYFSDHMFSLEYRDGRWGDPRILPYGEVGIEPGAASLHYGQTVFEGLKAFMGKDGRVRVFRPDMNAKRLLDSCGRICIPPIEPELFFEAIRLLVELDREWIPRKRGQALYIRPIIFSTESHLEVRPSRRFRFLVMTSPVRTYYEENKRTVALKVEEHYARATPGGTGFAKTGGNYAASLLPGDEARRQGFDQVLWTDGAQHQYAEEVGQMNIFFRFRDRVVTPKLRGTILPGVTRDSVLRLLADFGVRAEERLIPVDEVVEAIRSGGMREVFGAGTAAVISPVGRIAYRGETLLVNNDQPGELAERLYHEITAIQYGEIADRHGWNRLIDLEAEALPASAAG